MIHVDIKYANMISPKLEAFKLKTQVPYLANCRCPLCGDSQSNKKKARGYIYTKGQSLFYRCHNCSAGLTVGTLVKALDTSLYREYCMEKYKKDTVEPTPDIRRVRKPKAVTQSILKHLKKISQLPINHPAKQYVVNRMIPPNTHYKLFYVPKFMGYVNSFSPDKFKDIKKDEPRLIIPYFDRKNKLIAIQGRSFSKKGLRYITIRLDFDAPLVYNLNSIDLSEDIYCVEGPLDSLFLPNAVAVGSADLQRVNDILPKDRLVMVFDNQPRSPEIIALMNKAIMNENRMVIWPEHIKEKDINDMVLAGRNVLDVIQKNTFSGPRASLNFMTWRKC